jgi:hypothetical protein
MRLCYENLEKFCTKIEILPNFLFYFLILLIYTSTCVTVNSSNCPVSNERIINKKRFENNVNTFVPLLN